MLRNKRDNYLDNYRTDQLLGLLGFHKFQKIWAGEDGVFYGQGIPGLVHVLDFIMTFFKVGWLRL